ncbi:hypothetical protein GOP47_0005077 [Adiantum capillus-veneris]|uniref:PLATZ transcription factor family protein n=1 Tax=Adiantum capillus-veneris TaxID=13818 RepID=A0A9D4ZL22_ADICA|nr:hypothetical protein GOP47_0005077 [Adiantum capillus-veneris]
MVSICQHCLSDHDSHQLLQIRRYVYHDVIRLHDIQKLLDCSRVQAYTINSARVVFLKERPQPKSNKGLGSNCESCQRSLQDAYKFCSVACKVDMSFAATRQGGNETECIECDTSTTIVTTHQTTSCQMKKNGENIMGNQEWLDLDVATSTTSSESIKTAGSSSLSMSHCNVNIRSMPYAVCTTKSHHLACATMRAPRHPRPAHHHYPHESLNRLKMPDVSLCSSTIELIPFLLSKRRKCNKPHRSPFS